MAILMSRHQSDFGLSTGLVGLVGVSLVLKDHEAPMSWVDKEAGSGDGAMFLLFSLESEWGDG